VLDYELEIPVSDARDRNLNLFMQFCGVGYQVVCFIELFLPFAIQLSIVYPGAMNGFRRYELEPECTRSRSNYQDISLKNRHIRVFYI
jgi:hypothetical protein